MTSYLFIWRSRQLGQDVVMQETPKWHGEVSLYCNIIIVQGKNFSLQLLAVSTVLYILYLYIAYIFLFQ